MKPVLAFSAPALALAVTLTGCGSSSQSPQPVQSPQLPPATAAVSPATLATHTAGCKSGLLPAAFRADPKHSGRLTTHTYSASADVQAALEYDQMRSGARQVYLHRSGGAHSAVDGVASCVSMQFASKPQAARFFGSYRTLRRQAGRLAQRIAAPSVGRLAGTTAYLERRQSFRGYGIGSTNVIEFAGLSGSTLDIASVAGPSPSRPLATRLLKAMASSA